MKRLLVMALALNSCTTTQRQAALRECLASFSPNGHRASFTWNGGSTVTALACSLDCKEVLSLRRSDPVGYRWNGPDRLDFADPKATTERELAHIGELSVYAVPVAVLRQDGVPLQRVGSPLCTRVESTLILPR